MNYDPLSVSKDQNTLILWGANEQIFQKLSKSFNKEKDDRCSEGYQKMYTAYWLDACKYSATLATVTKIEKFLNDTFEQIKILKNLEIKGENIDEGCEKLGNSIMDFKTKSDIAPEIKNSLRLEFLIDSVYLKLNLNNENSTTTLMAIGNHEEFYSDRRDALIGLSSGFTVILNRAGVNFSQEKYQTKLCAFYPILSKLSELTLEANIDKEKVLLGSAIGNTEHKPTKTIKL